MSLWYIWLVGRWHGEQWSVVGIFSTHEQAKAAAFSGCFITTLPVDEVLRGDVVAAVDWIE